MHRPPAVSWEIRPARCPVLALLFLTLLGGLLILGFWIRQGPGAPGIFLIMTHLGGTLLAVRELRKPIAGFLQWDGERWHWPSQNAGAVTELVCVMDLQRCVLLRVTCSPNALHWLWLETRVKDGRWYALRRAVLASQKPDAKNDADGLADR